MVYDEHSTLRANGCFLWFMTSHAFLGAPCTAYGALSLSNVISQFTQQTELDDLAQSSTFPYISKCLVPVRKLKQA